MVWHKKEMDSGPITGRCVSPSREMGAAAPRPNTYSLRGTNAAPSDRLKVRLSAEMRELDYPPTPQFGRIGADCNRTVKHLRVTKTSDCGKPQVAVLGYCVSRAVP